MWNERKLQQLKNDGRIRGYSKPRSPSQNVKIVKVATQQKRSKEKEWLGWNLLYWANEHALTLEEDYRFDESRKWEFDYAFTAVKIAIEYEGLFSAKSRHTTPTGYTGDTDKYNQAQLLGWRVIRITALNYKTVLKTLNGYYDRSIGCNK